MKYLIDSIAEMNFNYLYVDESSISHNELIKKFVLTEDQIIHSHGKERVNSRISRKDSSQSNDKEIIYSENKSHCDNYYIVFIYNS